ncbi:transcription factor CP2-like protein 1 isoform X1 [Argonauta hians]
MSINWSDDSSTAGKRSKIIHNLPQVTNWDIDGGLAADFDGSLSGLGSELGSGTYNMSEALLALPVFKQENLENGFQYVLGAATSPAVKRNEETLTYLNQGQSYEIKLKKLGDLSNLKGKYIRSVVKVCFHERRLQFMEKEQLELWRLTRPGERLLDIDIPLSYGLIDVRLDPNKLNAAEFIWDPTKETGIYIRVHCISTEFTPKKHGGEKGVPFRIQVESHTSEDGESKLLYIASCQVKVFKPKGADRKHKTDREKMEKRSEAEKEKYQPSYECTVLTEIPLEQIINAQLSSFALSPDASFNSLSNSSTLSEVRSPLALGQQQVCTVDSAIIQSSSPKIGTSNTSVSSASSLSSPTSAVTVVAAASPSINQKPPPETSEPVSPALTGEATAQDVTTWLHQNRFVSYVRLFQNFSGADLLRLSRDDLIQICGLADGIRLNNALQAKCVRPRLTIYVCQEGDHVYHAVFLENLTSREIKQKLADLFTLEFHKISEILWQGPSGIHIVLNDEVVRNFQDQSRFLISAIKVFADNNNDIYKVLLKDLG